MAKTTEFPKSEDVGELREQVILLREQLESLSREVSVTSGLASIGKGLADLVEQIAPLRQLAPPRTGEDLPKPVVKALMALRASLKAPPWANVVSLDIDDWDVGYIGQADPPRGHTDQWAAITLAGLDSEDARLYPEGAEQS